MAKKKAEEVSMAKKKAEEDPYKKALNEVIDAWEVLRGNQNYSFSAVENWLRNNMAPAINKGRKVLNRPLPKI